MKLFVFPLPNIVLQPFTFKPLYIFEPRYLQMIHESISTQTPIGLASSYSDKTTIQNLKKDLTFVKKVCGFGMPHIVQQKSDGSLVILIDCVGKVCLEKSLDENKPFPICEGRVITEVDDVTENNKLLLQNLKDTLIKWIKSNSVDKSQNEQFIRSLSTASQIIGSYSDFLIKEPEFQQAVLEINSLNEKLEFIGLFNLSSNHYD